MLIDRYEHAGDLRKPSGVRIVRTFGDCVMVRMRIMKAALISRATFTDVDGHNP
jgi:spore coat polysaccharide biosynthesis protein SpsF (cytidylyltransferase family)